MPTTGMEHAVNELMAKPTREIRLSDIQVFKLTMLAALQGVPLDLTSVLGSERAREHIDKHLAAHDEDPIVWEGIESVRRDRIAGTKNVVITITYNAGAKL